jgi:hypothetical protein
MKKNKWIYISSALVGITAIYFIVKALKKDDGSNGGNGEGGGEGEDNQQNTSPTIIEMIKNKTIIGKNVITKYNSSILRTSAYVNDGVMNNKYGEIEKSNTLVGKVKYISQDKGGATNPTTKKPYNWLGVEITDSVYDTIQETQRNWLTRDVWANKKIPLWIREDIIKL